jgi:hypothetical protein
VARVKNIIGSGDVASSSAASSSSSYSTPTSSNRFEPDQLRPAPHNTARSLTRRPRSASGDPRRPRGHLLHPQGASRHPDLRLSLIRPPEPWRWRGGRPCLAWRSPALGSPARRPTPCRRLRRYSSAAAPVLFGFMPNFVLVLLCAVIRTEIERLTVGFSYRI